MDPNFLERLVRDTLVDQHNVLERVVQETYGHRRKQNEYFTKLAVSSKQSDLIYHVRKFHVSDYKILSHMINEKNATRLQFHKLEIIICGGRYDDVNNNNDNDTNDTINNNNNNNKNNDIDNDNDNDEVEEESNEESNEAIKEEVSVLAEALLSLKISRSKIYAQMNDNENEESNDDDRNTSNSASASDAIMDNKERECDLKSIDLFQEAILKFKLTTYPHLKGYDYIANIIKSTKTQELSLYDIKFRTKASIVALVGAFKENKTLRVLRMSNYIILEHTIKTVNTIPNEGWKEFTNLLTEDNNTTLQYIYENNGLPFYSYSDDDSTHNFNKIEKYGGEVAVLLLYLKCNRIGRKQYLENGDKNALIKAAATGRITPPKDNTKIAPNNNDNNTKKTIASMNELYVLLRAKPDNWSAIGTYSIPPKVRKARTWSDYQKAAKQIFYWCLLVRIFYEKFVENIQNPLLTDSIPQIGAIGLTLTVLIMLFPTFVYMGETYVQMYNK